ncbi:winged helix-turn-helix domain-containing protein [Bradyrhizobium sp.]|uniref:winged helix-turn-helix domain-containing protein n=1 Tax=Bradyrhizobium sp. TaxID=376 RepID=UPI003C4406A9
MLYVFDKYALDPGRRELRCGATLVAMEPQAFDLLLHLVRHREQVVSRDELIEQIWGGRIVSESALSTRINAVRSAIGDSGSEQRLIKTLPRKGVRFVGQVREERASTEPPAGGPRQHGTSESVDMHEVDGASPASPVPAAATIDGHWPAPARVVPKPVEPRRSAVRRPALAAVAAIGLSGFAALTWNHLVRSAHSERTRANVETAAKLNHISEQINMVSREDYEAARALEQWAVDLDPHNAAALARLTFAIVTGVLNHWSGDVIGDLHAADLSLQDAVRLAPDSMIVRGAQCHILRAMRQFEAGIRSCSEAARSFPNYPFLHKEIGYNRLMLGQLDEAMAEFLEADRISPESRMRWSWNQGIGLIYLMQGQDQKAIDLLSRAALEAPNAGHPAAYLASAYALAGREQEAREALDHYMKLWPNTALNNFGPMVGTAAFNSKMERVLAGLRLAGLPE